MEGCEGSSGFSFKPLALTLLFIHLTENVPFILFFHLLPEEKIQGI